MTEKTFNARLKLKYDTHEQWIANDPVLLQGEVALSVVSVKQDGTVNEVPSVLMKVGDGTHKYSELGFTYAKAADVIAAAKSADALTKFINNVIANAGIATDEALTALSGRVTTAEGKITTLEGKVGDKSVATQITEAIDALNLSETYATKSHTHTKSEITDFAHTHKIADVTGLSDSIADAKQAGLDATSALNTYKNTNDAAVSANTSAIAAINNTDTGILAQAKTYADGKDAAIAAAKKAGDDAQSTIDAYKTANDTRVKAVEDSIGTVTDGKTVVQMIKDEATTARAAEKANADAIKGVKELVGDTAVASQISTAINNLNLGATYEAKGAAAAVETKLNAYKTSNDTAVQTNASNIASVSSRVDDIEAELNGAEVFEPLSDSDIDALFA